MDKYRGASVRHTFSHGVIERLVNRVERQVAVEITIATIDRFDIGHAGAEEVEMGSGLVGRLTMRDYAIRMVRSEEHTSELQSLMRISYAVFCLKKKKQNTNRKFQSHIIHRRH